MWVITEPTSRGYSGRIDWVTQFSYIDAETVEGMADGGQTHSLKHPSTDCLLTAKQNASIMQAPGKPSFSPGSPASSRRGHGDILHLRRWYTENRTLMCLLTTVFDLTWPEAASHKSKQPFGRVAHLWPSLKLQCHEKQGIWKGL